MSWKTQKGGVVKDPAFLHLASRFKKTGETVVTFGPFKIEGKKFVIAAYFPSLKYWTTFLRNIPVLFTFLFPNIYLRQKNQDELIQGIRVYDSRKNTVEYNHSLYQESYRMTRIWMRVYFNPFYPTHTQIFEKRLILVKKLANQVKQQGYPSVSNDIEKLYVDKLRQANKQLYDQISVLEKHDKFARQLAETFKKISDTPTGYNIEKLQTTAIKFKSVLKEMSDWCLERANTWSGFIDAYSAYVENKENQNLIKKHGVRAIISGVFGLFLGVISGNSLILGFCYSVGADFGLAYVNDLIVKPKWQINTLNKSACLYLEDIKRVDQFLELYTISPNQQMYRFPID